MNTVLTDRQAIQNLNTAVANLRRPAAKRTRVPKLPPATPVAEVLAEIDADLKCKWNAEGAEWSKRPQLLKLRAVAEREAQPDDFQLLLYSVGNPDMGQYHGAGEGSPTIACAAATMVELRDAALAYISVYDLGGGNCPHFRIYRKGVEIAHVSYNGRCWTPNEFGTPEHKEIDPKTGQIIG